ncbi:hypothetical protein [Comamonas jiangduensis]|uniref:hypothetical protein n=1 Tax=Comamonas jiangduensis TaxID=1194168 RepID=UPI0028B13E7E|nr:hypothetical protein [Comamonas jiangduensis]
MGRECQHEGKQEQIESAYLSAVALDHMLQAAKDAQINAAMLRQLLKPVLQSLEQATD